jgi:monovalent cation:H+ antiporter-2, CPA2 family
MGIAADFVLIVIAGLIGGILARMLRLPLLVGYVFAGIAVGPYTAGPTVVQIHDIETLAEIGVALLLFSLGLEVSFRDLRIVRNVTIFGGTAQVLLTMAAAAAAGMLLVGMPSSEALWFGSMISVSSTMVVLKVMGAAGVTHTLASRIMIGLLLIQDLAVVPMLIVLPQLGGPADGMVWRIASALALGGAVLIAAYFAGTRFLPPVLRWILSWGSRELFLVAVVAISVGVGAGMHAVGLSFAIGAFVAGLMLSESELSHQALSDVVPLRDIFGLLFFVSVGMLFDPAYLFANPGLIAVSVVLVIFGKALIFGWIARGFGYRNMAPWIVGLGLSQVGEFSFVLARAGLSSTLVSKPVYDLALTVTVLSMAIAPLVSSAALPLGRAWRRWRNPKPLDREMALPELAISGHAIVAGYGRTGRAVAQALRDSGVSIIAVESNYSLYGDVVADGFDGLWGDITRTEILHAAGVERAQLLVLTMPDPGTLDLAIRGAQRANSQLLLIARSNQSLHMDQLRELGVSVAVQPEFEGGLEMVRQALLLFGQDDERTRLLVEQQRASFYGILKA